MNTKYIAIVLSVLLLASFLAIITIHSASATNATLSIPSVAKTPGDVGSTFTVPVQVSNIADLFAFDIKITWDNTLITFSSLDNSSLSTVWPQGNFEPLTPSPQTGTGYVRFAAVATGTPGFTSAGPTTLFTLTFTVAKADNFPLSTNLHFSVVELSDSNANTIPANLSDGTYTMSATVPGITLTLVNPNPSKPYEYGKYIEVQVNATNIVSTLTGYDLRVDYSSEFLTFVQVQPETYVLATPTVDTSTPGVVHLTVTSGGTYVGSSGLLCTLTFQILFDQRSTHIWRTSTAPNQLSATISLDTTTGNLAFVEGTIPVGSVTAPASLTIPINLIQGDVDCNGQVNILDLADVAHFYDQSTTSGPAALYDIKIDSNNIIDIYDLVEVAANFNYNKPDSLP